MQIARPLCSRCKKSPASIYAGSKPFCGSCFAKAVAESVPDSESQK